MTQTSDPVGQLDERAKGCNTRNSAPDQVADLVLFKPRRPNVIDLLHAQGDSARILVDLQNLRFDRIALLVDLGRILDSPGPGYVTHVNEAVEPFFNFEECPKFGEVADAPADDRAHGILFRELLPRVALYLFHPERNSPLVGIDAQHYHFYLVAFLDDFRWVLFAFRPAHFTNVDQPFNPWLELDEGAVVGQAHHFAGELGSR